VIDFIDMDHHSNARKVERAMKEALKNDRARIQVGRISGFGLMEMSRQRLRTGVLEASTRQCPHCEGTGLVRTASSSALSALRLIEEESARGHGSQISLLASQEATIYILNNKRSEITEIEDRYHVRVEVLPNGEIEGAKMTVTASGARPERPAIPAPIIDMDDDDDIDTFEDEIEEEAETAAEDRPARSESGDRDDRDGRRKRRRRGRRGGRNRERDGQDAAGSPEGDAAAQSPREADNAEAEPAAQPKRTRGRAKKAEVAEVPSEAEATPAEESLSTAPAKARRGGRKAKTIAEAEPSIEAPTDAAPAPEKPKTRGRTKAKAEAEPIIAVDGAKEAAKPKRASRKKVAEVADAGADEEGSGPRRGWWQRTFG